MAAEVFPHPAYNLLSPGRNRWSTVNKCITNTNILHHTLGAMTGTCPAASKYLLDREGPAQVWASFYHRLHGKPSQELLSFILRYPAFVPFTSQNFLALLWGLSLCLSVLLFSFFLFLDLEGLSNLFISQYSKSLGSSSINATLRKGHGEPWNGSNWDNW